MRANRKTVNTFEVCANMVIALAAETYFTKSRVGHYRTKWNNYKCRTTLYCNTVLYDKCVKKIQKNLVIA